MSDEHERIWLAPQCCADPDAGRYWAQDPSPWPCPDCTSNSRGVEYVRADLVAALRARAERAEAEAYRLRLAICGGEDAPGAVNAISVSDLEHLCRNRELTAKEWTEACVRNASAEALREAARVALAHKGSAAKKRLARGWRLGSLPAHAQDEIVAEERGEDIAAEIIYAAITALMEKEKPDA